MPKGNLSEVERLRREVQSLTAKLSKTSVQPQKKKRKRNKKVSPQQGMTSTDGHMRVKRRFPFAQLKVEANKSEYVSNICLTPKASAFAGLAALAAAFEKAMWHSVRIWYKPFVGSTVDGVVSYGVDWDQDTAATKRELINQYTPSDTTPVWQESTARPMVLSPGLLQNVKWWNIQSGTVTLAGPCAIVYGVTAPATSTTARVFGELWMEADLTFAGIRPA